MKDSDTCKLEISYPNSSPWFSQLYNVHQERTQISLLWFEKRRRDLVVDGDQSINGPHSILETISMIPQVINEVLRLDTIRRAKSEVQDDANWSFVERLKSLPAKPAQQILDNLTVFRRIYTNRPMESFPTLEKGKETSSRTSSWPQFDAETRWPVESLFGSGQKWIGNRPRSRNVYEEEAEMRTARVKGWFHYRLGSQRQG